MSGRRINSPEAVVKWLRGVISLYYSIDVPAAIRAQWLTACFKFFELPESLRDEDQTLQDVSEAIRLTTELEPADDELFRIIFWNALSQISAREHIVLQPGAASQGGRLQ